LLETAVANVTVDTSIASAVFALLAPLSIVITIGTGNALLVHFTASGANPGASNRTFFRLRVDGVVFKGATFTRGGGGGPGGECVAITAKITGLAAGSRTVDIQWSNSAGTTTIAAATLPSEQHATLLVEEVNV
jgi:hypothetical protein